MSQFDFKRPDLRFNTATGPSRSLIAAVWCAACILGALICQAVIGGIAGLFLSLVAIIGVAVLAYLCGLYTAGWSPGKGDPT